MKRSYNPSQMIRGGLYIKILHDSRPVLLFQTNTCLIKEIPYSDRNPIDICLKNVPGQCNTPGPSVAAHALRIDYKRSAKLEREEKARKEGATEAKRRARQGGGGVSHPSMEAEGWMFCMGREELN